MPQVLGSATLETMTTAQNRAVLADAEERALRAAPVPAEEAPRPDGGPDEPDDTTGSYALEARGALRRVAGLSTELADVTEVEYRQLRLERVVLVGVWTEGTQADADRSLAELAALADASVWAIRNHVRAIEKDQGPMAAAGDDDDEDEDENL